MHLKDLEKIMTSELQKLDESSWLKKSVVNTIMNYLRYK